MTQVGSATNHNSAFLNQYADQHLQSPEQIVFREPKRLLNSSKQFTR